MADAALKGRPVRAGPSLRPFLIDVHRYTGLVVLLFLALAAATGTLLVFSDSLDVALNPDLFKTPVKAEPRSPLVLAAAVQARDRRLLVLSVPLAVQRGRTLEMSVTRRPQAGEGGAASSAGLGFDQIFVRPDTGAIVGVRQDRPGLDRRHLMRALYLFHYTLLAGDPGRWAMGVVALAWVIENLVGVYLTLPRTGPFWRRWAPIWQVNFKASLPRVLLDLHRASGLWLFLGVMILSLTSFAMNFYAELVTPAVRALSPPAIAPWDGPAPTTPWRTPSLTFEAAERQALREAARERLGLRPAVATYDPVRRLVGIRFTGDGREQYAGLGPISYYYDDQSGRLVFIDNPLTDSAGEKVLRSLFPLHSGQVGGLITRLLVALMGLSILQMAVSGLIVWWKKRGPRIAARRAARTAGRAGRGLGASGVRS